MNIKTLLAGIALLAIAAPAHADVVITFDGYSSSANPKHPVNSGKDAQGSTWMWSKTTTAPKGLSVWGVPGLGKGDAVFETKTGFAATDFQVSFVYFKNIAIQETPTLGATQYTVFESEQAGKWYTWIPTFDGTKNVTWNAPTGVSLVNGEKYFVDVVFDKAGLSGSDAGFTAAFSAVPELSTWGMMLAGFGALAFAGYRRRPVVA
jgi:hypothetical protein